MKSGNTAPNVAGFGLVRKVAGFDTVMHTIPDTDHTSSIVIFSTEQLYHQVQLSRSIFCI
ncbi:MAG TPA: hypothetical protein VD735_02330 [Candidatus Saccharimonadales bacterium]|nr:hypothetical protein [Candidatus Saccharimonadales bacterium]